MNRVLLLGLIGAFLGGGLGALIAVSNEGETDIFIASDQPVTEDQVRAKLQSEGWSAIRVTKDKRYIEVTASKGGRMARCSSSGFSGQRAG